MTESDWHAKDAPRAMFEFVRSRASPRQLRHFGAACCRAVWDYLPDDRLKGAVECVEAYLAGGATQQGLAAAQSRARLAIQELALRMRATAQAQETARRPVPERDWEAYYSAYRAATASDAVALVARPTMRPAALAESVLQAFDLAVQALTVGRTVKDTYPRVHAAHAAAVRCVFGNPFQPIEFDPSWRTESVVGLTHGILADQAFDRLPVLADALEDAGCADAAVLGHLRGGGVHVRGCWCVDGVLGLG